MDTPKRGMPDEEREGKRAKYFPRLWFLDVADAWTHVKSAIQEILNNNTAGLSFGEFHKNVFVLVFNKHEERLYTGLKEVLTLYLEKKVRDDIMHSLHNNFLHDLNQAFKDYHKSICLIENMLHMDRRVCVREKNLANVHQLGLILFRDQIVRYDQIRDQLRETLMDMVKRERRGETVDRSAFKESSQMLVMLSVGGRTVYEEEFETHFLQQSSEFYRLEGQKFWTENNVTVYIRKVEQLISQESEWTNHCLDESTASRIVELAGEELINKHMKTLVEMENSGVAYMIKCHQTEDLACVYKLFSRVPYGLKTLAECINQYLGEQGLALVREGEGTNDITFVQNLLDLKDRFDLLLKNSFHNDKMLHQTIASNFEQFLNSNKNSPEYLSLFIDDKLRKGGGKGMSGAEVDAVLEKTMGLFRFLMEKDVFEIHYVRHLAKRLLFNHSVSEDMEKSMILQLQAERGVQVTRKLEWMLKDMAISKGILREFKEHVQGQGVNMCGVDLSVMVLTTGVWPLYSLTQKCTIPIAPRNAFESFERFYLAKHSGRRLTLMPQLGSAELSAMFYGVKQEEVEDGTGSQDSSQKIGPPKYIIQVSTYQMCILMLFTSRDRLSYEEIQNETGIPEKDLIRGLQSLSLGKEGQRVLLKSPPVMDIEPSHTFLVNDSFMSKLQRVKIPTIPPKGKSGKSGTEGKKIRDKVDEDRKHEIEAAIVRIMKAKKLLPHARLVAEVTEQLKSRFLPSPVVIRTKIEGLIDRDYLSRTLDDRKVYTYVA